MTKATRAQYTLEFKHEAVRMVESGQSIAQITFRTSPGWDGLKRMLRS